MKFCEQQIQVSMWEWGNSTRGRYVWGKLFVPGLSISQSQIREADHVPRESVVWPAGELLYFICEVALAVFF